MIGDVLLTTALGRSLRASFPDAQIDYLLYENSAPILANNKDFDNVIALSPAQQKNPLRYLVKVHQVASEGYDIVIDAMGTSKSEFVSWFARSATYRIGRKKARRGLAYTHAIAAEELSINKVDQRLALLQPLIEAGYPIRFDDSIRIHLLETEITAMRMTMLAHGIDRSKPVFAFAISARESYKKWRAENMQKVIEHCLQVHNAQVILLAGLDHEYKDVALMQKNLGSHPSVFSQIPASSLRELVALLSQCTMFIGNEGGPRHFADAAGIRSFVIVSPCASKTEWLRPDSSRHAAIEWRDIDAKAHPSVGSVSPSESAYQTLYDLITPESVIPELDTFLAQ